MATSVDPEEDDLDIAEVTDDELHVEEPVEMEPGKKRFEIRNWDAVALWAWDIEMSNCGICRNQIMDLCIECQANMDSVDVDECPIAWGTCNHAYHFHCISRFLKTHHVCPLDNQDWKYKKYGR